MDYSPRTSRARWSSEKPTREGEIWKGAAAGAVGGLLGSWMMNEFSPVIEKIASAAGNGQQQRQTANSEQQPEDATMITAEKISEAVAGIRLSKEQKKKGGTIVHYAFGALMGAVYGAAAEMLPPVTSLAGLPYGAALFIGVDEVTLSALGLTKMPNEYPLSSHLSGLGQHLVYGATTEFVRRTVRNRL
jgi:putative membrane protein